MREGLLAILVGFILLSCGDGNVRILLDPDIQRAEDSTEIADYFQAKGYDNFQITELGVWYIILDPGTGTQIDESDIVTFDYIGLLSNDSIFDTTIQAVGDSVRNVEGIPSKFTTTFTETKNYDPFVLTYSTSGWTINGFVPGFSNGIAASFNELSVGGRAIIAMPSELAYGQEPRGFLIPANSVLLFELLPTKVTKQ